MYRRRRPNSPQPAEIYGRVPKALNSWSSFAFQICFALLGFLRKVILGKNNDSPNSRWSKALLSNDSRAKTSSFVATRCKDDGSMRQSAGYMDPRSQGILFVGHDEMHQPHLHQPHLRYAEQCPCAADLE